MRMREWEIRFSETDVQELIEYKDIFIKYLQTCINRIRANLWMWNYNWKEVQAYIGISTIEWIISDAEKTQEHYTDLLKKREEAKGAKKAKKKK
jgi:hypothetical protein